ncbi:hypothetical protein EGI26_12760 [Lacihabitans sp. CCS-44]|nr:hypothetical protein [Lacihabitans sp. CCS-44]
MVHKSAAYLINLILISLLLYTTKVNDNDKSPIIFMLGYGLLFIINALVFLFLFLFKSQNKKIYSTILMGMILLLIPLILILSEL